MTRTVLRLVLAAALLALALPPAAGEASVIVTLRIGDDYHLLSPTKACDVAVPAGASGADVLDQAEDDGCITGWSYVDFGQDGQADRYVTCLDGRCQGDDRYWVFAHTRTLPVAGQSPVETTTDYGIDHPDAQAREGAVYDFRYAGLASFFLP